MLKKYDSAYWVITPSKFMHEFKTDDDFAKDPAPETSLYLPDCVVGALDGNKFAVKGKDVSGSSIGNKLAMSHEYSFRAHTPQDAQKWWEALRGATGSTTNELPTSAATSPSVSRAPTNASVSPTNDSPSTAAAPEVAPIPESEKATAGAAEGVATGDKVA